MSDKEIQETIELFQRHAAVNQGLLPTFKMAYKDYMMALSDDSDPREMRIINKTPQILIDGEWHRIEITNSP